ncbi:MAG: S46 family peptidase [Flavobacteriales bacterium AspAUS03]
MIRTDERIWLLNLIKDLNYTDIQKQVLKLTAEKIYSINSFSLKNAIVNFSGFCTSEIISAQGLLFTNHHCIYNAITGFFSIKNNYLKNYF